MTAEINNECVESNSNANTVNSALYAHEAEAEATAASAAATIQLNELTNEIISIIEFLSFNSKIIFKSQQIDDPELLRSEKVQIAREIYAKSRQTFLMRFGNYMEEQHLTTFSHLILNDSHREDMLLLLQDYHNKLHTRKRDVKNRRYAAMQQLIEDGEYFSEQEMMKRAPELYQDLIGQYLSEAEKKQRDEYDVKNTTFSGILMHTMEQRELQDVLQQADEANVKIKQIYKDESIEDVTSQSSNSNSNSCGVKKIEAIDADYDEVPASFRQQWGNFDNETVACSTSRQSNINSKSKKIEKIKRKPGTKPRTDTFITAGERDLLRQEFIGIMHEQFLNGDDKEFDYTLVDENSQLDDLSQLNRDKEDAYFEESDCSDNNSRESPAIQNDVRDDEQSEDELDVFMSHLSKHHSLQQM